MEGKKTTARRSRRTASAPHAPASGSKESARRPSPKQKTPARTVRGRIPTVHEKRHMVAMAAYFRAERRGFAPGHEVEDWAAAEAEIEARLAGVPEKKPARRARKSAST